MVCLEFNHQVVQAAVVDRVAAGTQRHYDVFLECDNCQKLYWKGSHYRKVADWVRALEQS